MTKQMSVREIQQTLEGTGFTFKAADMNAKETKDVLAQQSIQPTRSEIYCIVDADGKLVEFPEQLRERLLASKEVKTQYVKRLQGGTAITSDGQSVIISREGEPIAGQVKPGDLIEYSVTQANTVRAMRTFTDPATGAVETSSKFVWVSTTDSAVVTAKFDDEQQFLRANKDANAVLAGEKAKQSFIGAILQKAADPNVSLADAMAAGQALGLTA